VPVFDLGSARDRDYSVAAKGLFACLALNNPRVRDISVAQGRSAASDPGEKAMSTKSTVIAAAIAVLGLGSPAFAQSQPAACSDQISELRQTASLNHQPTPGTVFQAQTYAQLTFAADLALAEAQNAEGRNDECLLAARRAKDELQGQTG
jgi:hypothetical protein